MTKHVPAAEKQLEPAIHGLESNFIGQSLPRTALNATKPASLCLAI